MSGAIRCFMVRPTGRELRYLRRFVFTEKGTASCSGPGGYHDARVAIGEGPTSYCADGRYLTHPDPDRADLRWPKACACGYVFTEADQWQVFTEQLLADDTGRAFSERQLPPGAIREAWWIFDPKDPEDVAQLPKLVEAARTGAKGMLSLRYLERDAADRPPLEVTLPNGRGWLIDAPATNGPGWTCQGTAPDLTCTPSILAGDYHGWLTGGQLVPC